MPRSLTRVAAVAVSAVAVTAGVAACGPSDTSGSGSGSSVATVKLGFFPNVTHATPIVGVQEGLFAKHLGGTKLTTSPFTAGPAAMEALKSGAVDATFVGPGPVTNGFTNTGGAIRVIAGAASGGAEFVVNSSIKSVADLKGQKVASPQLANTQDIALRYYLKSKGLTTDLQGGGDVNIVPTENATVTDAFTQKFIVGAWVPEPYATKLVQAGGHVLVNEASLWPKGKFATTVLAVRTDFMEKHPDTVKQLLQGELDATAFIKKSPAKAQQDVADLITKLSGKELKVSLVSAAWKNLDFTADPVGASIRTGADHSFALGVLKQKPDLAKMINVSALNSLLKAAGQPEVTP